MASKRLGALPLPRAAAVSTGVRVLEYGDEALEHVLALGALELALLEVLRERELARLEDEARLLVLEVIDEGHDVLGAELPEELELLDEGARLRVQLDGHLVRVRG